MASIKTKACFCNCKTCTEIRIVLKKIYKILKYYDWLINAYVVDFFYENLWSRLPLSWRELLKQLTPYELGSWLLGEKKCTKTVLPLSLIALQRACKILEINRNHNNLFIYKCNSKQNEDILYNKNKKKTETEETKSSELCHLENNLLLKHVKGKKRYEIDKIAKILSQLSERTNSNCIIDIGAGMGHLSRFLAVKHNLQVICVEQDEILLDRARQWDEELIRTMKKHDSTFTLKIPYHLAVTINALNIQSELIDKISENLNLENGFGIVGLHPCGDLAVNLLKLYCDCYEAKFLCIVGCCYMKLSMSDCSSDLKSYPLSAFVNEIPNNTFSYNALEVACHAKEKYFDKMKLGDYNDLKIHTYRATLEYLLAKINVKNRHGQLRSVKLKNETTFQQYCKLALEKTEFQNILMNIDVNNENCSQMLNQWKEVLIFGCLRLILAPLVETAILLDRFLYLSENNLRPSLKAEFDSRISPRNFVLTSYKT